MQASYDNFIGVYDGVFTDAYCNSLIDYFEWCNKNNRAFGRPDQERIKNDTSALLNPVSQQTLAFTTPNLSLYINEFNQGFWEQCYKDYIQKYSVLADYDKHTIYTYKIQRTDPGGGYHIWHSEDGSKEFAQRVGVYILYLNDVEEGGETEFLYLSKRVAPKKGRLVIFPANYPWAHRGNPPLAGTKYIMTGWTEFA